MAVFYLPKAEAEFVASQPKHYLRDLVRADMDAPMTVAEILTAVAPEFCLHCGIRLQRPGAAVCFHCGSTQVVE